MKMEQIDVYQPSKLVLKHIKDVSDRLVKFQKTYHNRTNYEKIILMSIIQKIIDKKINAYVPEDESNKSPGSPQECVCVYSENYGEAAYQRLVFSKIGNDKAVNYSNAPFEKDIVFSNENEEKEGLQNQKKTCMCDDGKINSKEVANETLKVRFQESYKNKK